VTTRLPSWVAVPTPRGQHRELFAEQRLPVVTVGATLGERGLRASRCPRRKSVRVLSAPRFKPDVDRRLVDVYDASQIIGYGDEPIVSGSRRSPTSGARPVRAPSIRGGGLRWQPRAPLRDTARAAGASVTGVIGIPRHACWFSARLSGCLGPRHPFVGLH
jgi:hypothetical protein